eukprot:CAMPEP_0177786170 /NCGR_PEP_ID=MMETSP0491_2-20121128/20773_1 /TAXON_ID=63592 /ORGANISM="Tetraselmis chuii, Strain PLY429" /LENGTH=58 /DNA_ID=CAMNT_0019307349 /DNA_START=1300 /DNA_END=1476 /DNA_ORIENTATION=-
MSTTNIPSVSPFVTCRHPFDRKSTTAPRPSATSALARCNASATAALRIADCLSGTSVA